MSWALVSPPALGYLRVTVRFRSKPLVVLSILLVLTTGSLGAWHAPDDRLDEAPVVGTDADRDAQLSRPESPSAPDQHCAFCHWLRAFGNGAPVAINVIAAQSFEVNRALAFVERVRTTARLTLPSRAPPLA